jgi:hypothetical protein
MSQLHQDRQPRVKSTFYRITRSQFCTSSRNRVRPLPPPSPQGCIFSAKQSHDTCRIRHRNRAHCCASQVCLCQLKLLVNARPVSGITVLNALWSARPTDIDPRIVLESGDDVDPSSKQCVTNWCRQRELHWFIFKLFFTMIRCLQSGSIYASSVRRTDIAQNLQQCYCD